MLKYGDISVINNGNSKLLVPRNLSYRQKELFKFKMSESEILSAIQLNIFDIPNLKVIISDSISISKIAIVYIDIIKKKTPAENQITINDKLLITDITDLKPIPTFKYLFTKNGSLQAESLDIKIQHVEIQDNVIYLNSKFITNMKGDINKIKYDSMISGFIFPQVNDQPIFSGYKNYTGMLLMPSNYYINKSNIEGNISFVKYLDNNNNQYYFPENKNKYKQSLRLIRTNYQFNNQSTSIFENKLDVIKDADIVDLNLTDNLVNLEVNNIAMRDGNFVLLTNKSFNPNDGSVEGAIDLSANFSFWSSDLSGLKQLVKITNDTTSIITVLDLSANGIIKFGSKNLHINNGSDVVVISNDIIDSSANLNLLNDTPFITLKTGKELIIKDTSNYIGFINNNIKIYQPLDLSTNGIIKFDINIKINNGISDVISINSATIDSSANINLLNDTPFITFKNTSELKIKDDLISYLGFNDNIIVYQPLDLSPNGIIKFGTNIKINNGTSDVISINSAGIISTFGSILTNTINPNSGTTISSTSIWNFKNGANIPILLDPTSITGNRLQIYGVVGGTRYLFFDASNNIGVFNTGTSANVWSINGTTGNITTIGLATYSTLSATLLLCNSIAPISPATTITFDITSNINFLKSAGVNRIMMYPSSTTDDVIKIYQTGSNVDGFLYFNNNGILGFFYNSLSNWTISNAGALTCTTIQTNGNTINCGPINSGALTCTTIQTNGNPINCGLINSGALTCTTIQTNGNTIICGYISSDSISCSNTLIVTKIVGGSSTSAPGTNAVVCGGRNNTASGNLSFVGGGGYDGYYSLVGNIASGQASSVLGGLNNIASNMASSICGGISNIASGWASHVGGGYNNKALGSYTCILAGWNNTISIDNFHSSILAGSDITTNENYTAYTYNLRANGDIKSTRDMYWNQGITFSDERIKTNIRDINDTSALAIIRQIQPKIYNYKDVRTRGDTPVWGFIAQEVKAVLDYSTTQIKECIPDIYELADLLDSNTIKLNIKTTVNFEVNKRIRLMKPDNYIMDTKITGIIDDYTFTVEGNITGFLDGHHGVSDNPINIASGSDNHTVPTVPAEETIPQQKQIFVYGREVDDFHALNKDAIFTVATAALQEVDKELQETVKELQAEKSLRQLLETRLSDLENKLINIVNKNIELENRILYLENKNTV